MMHKIFFLFLLIIFICFPAPAFAHDASLTFTNIVVNDTSVEVTMTTPYNNILQSSADPTTSIEKLDPTFFTSKLHDGFQITSDTMSCRPKLTSVKRNADIKSFTYDYLYTCPKPIKQLQFTYNLFFTISPTHENITDIHAGSFEQQLIFSSTNHVLTIDYAKLQSDSKTSDLIIRIFTFLKTGILHILTGYDHILFLLGLLIVTTRLKSLLKVITSFTLAHSITLSIATLGIFLFPARFTESMIALSIVYVAIEDIFILKSTSHSTKYRWLIAFLFGLIHGFGFSSALREVGLPQSEIAPALISFNVGVEIGQLVIIACLYPIITLLRKKTWGGKVIKSLTIVTGVLGFVWFVQRAFGL